MMCDLGSMAADYGISLTGEMLSEFEVYASLLTEWNQKMNLTAITDPGEVAVKHFLDSLLVLRALEVPQGASLIDVGTGAGFPAVPMRIVRGDLRVTLLDSLRKRIAFLSALSDALGQANDLIHGRAEEYGRRPDCREKFDLATARAVAALPALCEYCLPFVRVGGCFIALKGGDVEEEAAAAAEAVRLLGGRITDVRSFVLPDSSARSIIIIKKISHTPAKYPRISVKITKSPL